MLYASAYVYACAHVHTHVLSTEPAWEQSTLTSVSTPSPGSSFLNGTVHSKESRLLGEKADSRAEVWKVRVSLTHWCQEMRTLTQSAGGSSGLRNRPEDAPRDQIRDNRVSTYVLMIIGTVP